MSKHLKREVAPIFWPIPRKRKTWVVKTAPGTHPIRNSFPLLLIVRDVLKIAKTHREAKTIIKTANVKVDGKIRKEERFPVGLMDVIDFPTLGRTYRVIPSPRGLTVYEIQKDETKFKLCRIENKVTVRGGRIQLNLHDGRNILVKTGEEDVYNVLDALKIGLPEQKILGHVKMDVGTLSMIINGKNAGRIGKIEKIDRKKGPYPTMVTIDDGKGNKFQTISKYVFPIGLDKPLISVPKM